MSTISQAAQRSGSLSRLFRPRKEHERGWQLPWLWVLPAVVIMGAFHYVADAAGAYYAFTDWTGASANAKFIGLRNFREIFSESSARGALWHTILLAACFVVLVNVIGLALAVGLRRSVRSRHFIRALFFAPVIMSPLAVSYIWTYLFDFNGPVNGLLGIVGLASAQQDWLGSPTYAIWAVLVVLVWQFSGLAMIFYLAGLQGIPEDLNEASEVDGARPWYRFRRITLPLLAPAITVSATFTLILGLRLFDQVLALTGGGPVDATETLATQVYKQTYVNGRFGYGAALSVVLTVLVMIIALAQLAFLRARERRI